MQENNVLLDCLDIAEVIFKFAKDAWTFISKDLGTILNIDISSIPEWAEPLSGVLSWTFIEFLIGGFGLYIVYSIAKWIVGIITG